MQRIEKPWGREELLEANDVYVLKRLHMLHGKRCSLQYHQEKRETIYVLSGRLQILLGPDPQHLEKLIYEANQMVTIPPHFVHRMAALDDSVYLEASSPQLDDVVRLEDDYQRETR